MKKRINIVFSYSFWISMGLFLLQGISGIHPLLAQKNSEKYVVYKFLTRVKFDSSKYKNQAEKILRDGYVGDAILIYEKIVQNLPDDLESRKRLSQLYTWNENLDKAIFQLEYVTKMDTSDLTSLKLLAQYYTWNGKQIQAIDIYRRILMYEQNNLQLRKKLAQLYSWNNRQGEAIQEYEKIIEKDTTDIPILKILAQNYFWTERPKKGIKLLEKIVASEPDSIEYRRQLAQQYIWNDMQDKAIIQDEEILKYDPTDSTTIKQLAKLYTWNNAHEKAVPLYRTLLNQNPDNDSIRLLLGESQYYASKWYDAKKNFMQIEKNDFKNKKIEEFLKNINTIYSPHLTLEFSHMDDSNKLSWQQFPLFYSMYTNNKWEFNTKILGQRIIDSKIDSTVKSVGLEIGSHYHASKNLTSEFNIGISTFSSKWTPLNYKIKLNYNIKNRIYTYISYQHLESNESVISICEKITTNKILAAVYHEITKKWNMSGQINFSFYSDNNTKKTFSLSSNYFLIKKNPSLIFYSYYIYEDFVKIYQSSFPYWTPDKLETFSAGVNITQQFQSWLMVGGGYGLAKQGKLLANNFRLNIRTIFLKNHRFTLQFEQSGAKVYNSNLLKVNYHYRF